MAAQPIFVSGDMMLAHGINIFRHNSHKQRKGDADKFNRLFGIKSTVTALVWNVIEHRGLVTDRNRCPKHLLWALLFMKNYQTESVATSMCKCDGKTFRKWVWLYVGYLSNLDMVSLSSSTSSFSFFP
jgi:hypothetical protein